MAMLYGNQKFKCEPGFAFQFAHGRGLAQMVEGDGIVREVPSLITGQAKKFHARIGLLESCGSDSWETTCAIST